MDGAARAAALGQTPFVVWLTGLSGSGKSTLACSLDTELHARGMHTYGLDGDHVRRGLCRDLGFDEAARTENIRRVAEVARLMTDAGLVVIVAFISPLRRQRQMARELLSDHPFLEVFVDTPLAVAEARDPKGLYARARRGELAHFTGVDAPYEPPAHPELHLDMSALGPARAAAMVLERLERDGLAPPRGGA